jgi:hypothetical protein
MDDEPGGNGYAGFWGAFLYIFIIIIYPVWWKNGSRRLQSTYTGNTQPKDCIEGQFAVDSGHDTEADIDTAVISFLRVQGA